MWDIEAQAGETGYSAALYKEGFSPLALCDVVCPLLLENVGNKFFFQWH